MRRIRLIASDLDGTLLDSEKRLSPANAEALARAAAEGVFIVPATGRFYKGMPENIRSLPYVRYVITVNGAELFDAKEEKTLFSCDFTPERALEIMRFLDTLPVIYDCYQSGWGWMTADMYDKAEDYTVTKHSLEMVRVLRHPVPDLKEHIARTGENVQKIQMFFKDMDERAKAFPLLAERFPDVAVTSAIRNNIELNRKDATKGNALRKLMRILKIRKDETAAFGDDLNDISMLQAAGTGVAMGNANEDVKRASDLITADCDHDGVTQAMRSILGWE